MQEYINESLTGTTYDIGRVIYEKYREEYVCTKKKEWYEYRNNRWRRDKEGIRLKKRMNEEIVEIYEKEIEKEMEEGKREKMREIINKLKEMTNKEKIMRECEIMFYDGEWKGKLDTKEMLINFENGTYDLEKKEFRKGRREDGISMTTGKEYITEKEIPEGKMEEIEEYMEELFPKKEMREYVKRVIGSLLEGRNREKIYVWMGKGGNGKSTLIELIEATMGEYGGRLNMEMLTRRGNIMANPEMAGTRGKRICTIIETNEEMRKERMKELIGGEKIIVKGIYGEPFEMRAQFKTIIISNKKPKIRMEEMEIIEFRSKFVEEPKGENEYKRRDMTKKIEEWSKYFMNRMIKYYYKYKEEGMKAPKEVIEMMKE